MKILFYYFIFLFPIVKNITWLRLDSMNKIQSEFESKLRKDSLPPVDTVSSYDYTINKPF